MVLSHYTYIFVLGTGFSLLDAFNNGANDVANSWATSVSSRSITYRQAMMAGALFEFLGAVTVGARTADTIKNGIIPGGAFKNNAGVQMLAFASALAGSSLWLTFCTRRSIHVSSTYSLISSLAGVGIATVGASQVQWGWNSGKGLGAIYAGLGLAPAISAGFGAVIYGLIKYLVLVRKNNMTAWAIYTTPFFFFVAGTISSLSIIYKGAPQLGLGKKPDWVIALAVVLTGTVLAILSALFIVPFVYGKVVKRDYTLRWYHMIQGPLLFKRPAPADAGESVIEDYSPDRDYRQKVEAGLIAPHTPEGSDEGKLEAGSDLAADPLKKLPHGDAIDSHEGREGAFAYDSVLHNQLEKKGPLGWALRKLRDNPRPAGEAYEIKVITNFLFNRLVPSICVALLYGAHYDIHAAQGGIQGTPDADRMNRVYSYAKRYPNEVEHAYSFVQVLTACTASFAHGSNDVGNAIAPWAVIYSAWKTGDVAAAKIPVPVWQLAIGGIMIAIGLATYGYNIMKVMGNKLTYHSPSRGCSMELGAATTVLLAAQYGLPVSTSMCITGATVGVGLMNGHIRAVNWNRVALLLGGWLVTIPIAGLIGGCIMGILLNSPHF